MKIKILPDNIEIQTKKVLKGDILYSHVWLDG